MPEAEKNVYLYADIHLMSVIYNLIMKKNTFFLALLAFAAVSATGKAQSEFELVTQTLSNFQVLNA